MYQSDLVPYFRSLDAALDEHKRKGTPTGHTAYKIMFEQLAEDLATLGVGRDHIRAIAQDCGHLSTFKRLEQLMTMQSQPEESAAISLFQEQAAKLQVVRQLDFKNPQFISWKNTTTALFQRFSADSPHFTTFQYLRFRGQITVRRQRFGYRGPTPTANISAEDNVRFEADCAIADECIKGAIEEIRNFGIYAKEARVKTPQKGGGVQQTFHGPVVINQQTIATDNAIQNIGQVGNSGASLKEIADLLDQSMELTGRQRLEGLKAVEDIALEVSKPESSRDWKSILDWGEKLVSITGKATDLTTKLAPHLPAITGLIHEAMKRL